jgi:hypothetical protein
MTKKSYFERTGKNPPGYMVKRGEDLAASNRKCEGTPNNEGQFYTCVSKDQVRKHKKKK